jgi:hypothetical protein
MTLRQRFEHGRQTRRQRHGGMRASALAQSLRTCIGTSLVVACLLALIWSVSVAIALVMTATTGPDIF